jgi:hypothetical protein
MPGNQFAEAIKAIVQCEPCDTGRRVDVAAGGAFELLALVGQRHVHRAGHVVGGGRDPECVGGNELHRQGKGKVEGVFL